MKQQNPTRSAYKLQKGDTLYRIAREYNTLVPMILADNPHINPYDLQIGETIYIYPNSAIREEQVQERGNTGAAEMAEMAEAGEMGEMGEIGERAEMAERFFRPRPPSRPAEPLPTPEMCPPCPPCPPCPELPPAIVIPNPPPQPSRPPRPIRPPRPQRPRPPIMPFRMADASQSISSPLPNMPDMPYTAHAPQQSAPEHMQADRVCVNEEEVYFMHSMRRIFAQMVGTKHKMIVSKAHNLGDLEHIRSCAGSFSTQFADLMKTCYEPDLVSPSENLFSRHCELFERLLDSYANGDLSTAMDTEIESRQNADEIAEALFTLSASSDRSNVRQEINTHIDLIKKLITTRISGEYKENFEILEIAENQALDVADAVSSGVFPQ